LVLDELNDMKQWARRRREETVAHTRDGVCTTEASVAILLDVWDAITQDEVINAWDHLSSVAHECITV
jgi:hypothetical protein